MEIESNNHVSISKDPPIKNLPFNLKYIPRIILLVLVRIYQKILSPLLPKDTCRFYPTCSHYGYLAIYKYGVFKGGWLAIKRVVRCNPFNAGGFDPVP